MMFKISLVYFCQVFQSNKDNLQTDLFDTKMGP